MISPVYGHAGLRSDHCRRRCRWAYGGDGRRPSRFQRRSHRAERSAAARSSTPNASTIFPALCRPLPAMNSGRCCSSRRKPLARNSCSTRWRALASKTCDRIVRTAGTEPCAPVQSSSRRLDAARARNPRRGEIHWQRGVVLCVLRRTAVQGARSLRRRRRRYRVRRSAGVIGPRRACKIFHRGDTPRRSSIYVPG